MALFAALFDSVLNVYISVVLRCNKKLERLPKLDNFGADIGVRMEKSGPLKRARLANQVQGFRFPTMLKLA